MKHSTKVGIVTGTSRGLGRAIAEHLLGAGWHIAGCSRKSPGPVHSNYQHFHLDVAEERKVVAMVREVARSHGRIDALINNAGEASLNALLLTPVSVAETLMRSNYIGAFTFLKECAKIMVRQHAGRIVNMSTVAVPLALEGEAAYVASKAAVEALTRVAANELRTYGVTVNAVGPGPVDTSLTRAIPSEKIEAVNRSIGRTGIGSAQEVVEAVISFLRDDTAQVTGTIVYLGSVS